MEENVENTSYLSERSRKKMIEEQDNNSSEIENAVPKITKSEKLSNVKISSLDISKIDVPEGINLDNISIKDTINTSKVNMSTYDLSNIKTSDLNISFLSKLGFTVLAIIGLTKLIIDKIKDVDEEIKKEKLKNKEEKGNIIINTTLNNNVDDDKSDKIDKKISDKYLKPRKNTIKKRKTNSPYTIDKRERIDILNSSKSKSSKMKSINYRSNPNYGKYLDSII